MLKAVKVTRIFSRVRSALPRSARHGDHTHGLVGCTPQEIVSVTGHSLKTVHDGGRAQLAEQAIAKLDLSARSPSLGPSVDDR
jgi:hypothetical protein